MKIQEAKAHCDIPCAVYDPGVAQYAALSVVRFLALIGEMPENIESKKISSGHSLNWRGHIYRNFSLSVPRLLI